MSNIISVNGGCTSKNKPVGFQFKAAGNDCFLGRTYIVHDYGDGGGSESDVSGCFKYGQGYTGCRACGNKYVYQCHNCGAFNCYDGNETLSVVCPCCGEAGNVPASSANRDDSLIVRSMPIIEVILAIDVSSSMNETVAYGKTRLDEMKSAAVNNFVRALNGVKIAVVTFGTSVDTALDFTPDMSLAESTINSLTAQGGTSSPLAHIRRSFADYSEQMQGANRYIVVFTDGEWAGSGHETTAKKLKDDGVSIIAIGCSGADQKFLSEIATQGASIKAAGDDFAAVFATAAKLVTQ